MNRKLSIWTYLPAFLIWVAAPMPLWIMVGMLIFFS